MNKIDKITMNILLRITLPIIIGITKIMLLFLPRWAGMSRAEFNEKVKNTDIEELARHIAESVKEQQEDREKHE